MLPLVRFVLSNRFMFKHRWCFAGAKGWSCLLNISANKPPAWLQPCRCFSREIPNILRAQNMNKQLTRALCSFAFESLKTCSRRNFIFREKFFRWMKQRYENLHKFFILFFCVFGRKANEKLSINHYFTTTKGEEKIFEKGNGGKFERKRSM